MLQLKNLTYKSRLIIGSGKFSSNALMPKVIEASGAEIVTLALRRVDPGKSDEDILRHIPEHLSILPNTSGARNADEAVRIARLSRAMGCGNLIKIEVIHDSKYLMPDNEETIKATSILAKEDFVVLPYMTPDLIAAQKMVSAGASAVMPLGAPIGSNRGFLTKEIVRLMVDEISVPIIVDAGIGKPSDACDAMELGVDAVMVNTAIATAGDPIEMAKAFRMAVEAGRMAYESGLGRTLKEASASSPLTGFLGAAHE